MVRWLRFGGWAIIGIALLWIALRLVSIVFGLISFVVRMAISAFLAAVVLYLAYVLVSKALGRRSRSRDPKELYE